MNHSEVVLSEWQRLDALIDGSESSEISLSGRGLSISDVVFVARYHGNASISASALQYMEKTLAMLTDRLHAGEVIYGVNTGFGGNADTRTKEFVKLQRALIRELHYGVLPTGERDHQTAVHESNVAKHRHDMTFEQDGNDSHVPWSWARGSILIRINSLISGCSAVRPIIVERMLDLLKHDIIPMIPLRGSISASGDLSPLSYICGAIQGKSTIRVLSRGSSHVYADAAFASAGLDPVVLQAKEGLAMTNGTGISCAVGALALHDTHGLAVFAQVLSAMTVEALTGNTENFHAFFSESRPHPGQIESARNILEFLEGSKLTKINDGAGSTLRQDRYSIRTVPQWIGPILEDLVLAHQQVTIECNSVTDNPLVTPEGEFLHGGNFQAKAVTSAVEKARQGIQGIGRMLFAQCTELINVATNRGLPPNLIAEDPSISLIFKGTDLNIASLAAELGFLAGPVNHVQTAEMGNQSLNSLALISARYTHTAIEVLSQLMACHLIAVCQALDLRAMHVKFLGLYESQFNSLVSEHFSNPEQKGTSPSITFPVANMLASATQSPASNGVAADSGDQADRIADENPPDTISFEGESSVEMLTKSLWAQLLLSFNTTASLDVRDRFVAIAKSLRPVVLDTPGFNQDADLVPRLERFTEALRHSLHDVWCANRDAYLVHGDAAPVLGKASKEVYTFVRRTLNVPLMATRNLMTPALGRVKGGLGSQSNQAPTVGSYTGAVYRAFRDGTLVKVAVSLLEVDTQGGHINV